MLLSLSVLAASSTTAGSSSTGGLLGPVARPIAWLLEQIYAVIPNYAVAILILSVIWMILISPLTLKSTRSMLAMSKLQPQLKRLQQQHRNDRQAFAQAQMELFKAHNVSPFGSCLPSLLPLPIFFALFEVIDGLSKTVVVNGQRIAQPHYLSPSSAMYQAIVKADGHLNSFGLDLSQNALSHHASFAVAIPYYLLLLAMIGTSYLQTVQMMSRNPQSQSSQQQFMKYLPVVFGLICIRFPAGVILYYAMSNLCRIGQQSAMYRFDPRVKALVAQEVVEVEAKTRELDQRKPAPQSQQPSGRSRFRELLANAQEQANEQRRGGPSGGGTSRQGGTARKGTGGRPQPKSGGKPPSTAANGRGKPAKGERPTTGGTNGRDGRAGDGRDQSPAQQPRRQPPARNLPGGNRPAQPGGNRPRSGKKRKGR